MRFKQIKQLIAFFKFLEPEQTTLSNNKKKYQKKQK